MLHFPSTLVSHFDMTPAEKQNFLDSPALEPPAGTQPNLHNPSSLHFLGPGILQLSLVSLLVAMRLYAKVMVAKNVRVEDCERVPSPCISWSLLITGPDVLLLAWVCALGESGLSPALILVKAFFAGSFYPIMFLLNELPMGVHQWNMVRYFHVV